MIRMERRIRAALALALVLCLAACLLPGAALAADSVDLRQRGRIRLDLSAADYTEELAEARVDVDVYLVAAITGSGSYVAAEPFEELAGELARFPTGTNMSRLTEKLLGIVYPALEEEEKEEEGEPIPAFAPDFTAEELPLLGGEIEFSTLGLYLLIPHDAQLGLHSYAFAPMLLSVPAHGTDEEAENGRDPDAEGEWSWQYEYTIFLKAERSDRTGPLWIEKQLLRYNESLGEATFVFEITAVKDGEIVYSDVMALSFDAPGVKRLLIEELPVGAVVTVREVYSGGSYHLLSDGTVTVTIAPEEEGQEPITVTFVNDYDDSILPSVGVVNQFTKSGLGWKWDQVRDNSVEQGGMAG